MARDAGLEQLLTEDLAALPGLTTTKMFGGFAWMLQGNLLCCANMDGILFRLGKGNDAWTTDQPAVSPMIMGGRIMEGWVRLQANETGNEALRLRLLHAAQSFVKSLPPK
jgi:hypothetical protein